MGKVVVLKIANGDFDCGFQVSLAIGEDGVHHFAETKGQLPPAPDMIRHYTDWQSTYRLIVHPFGVRLSAKKGQSTNPEDLLKHNTKASEQLEKSVNQWLNSGEFSLIREKLKQALNTDEDVRFIVQTDDSNLQRLPWHLWTLWEDYHRSEIAFSLSSYQRLAKQAANQPKEQVRILAVFGGNAPINCLQLNLEEDWKTLQNNFPDAEIIRLNQPTLEDLGNRIWNEQFDIIFYSGHSSSEKDRTKNWLVINEQENIELRSLKFAFQRAVRRGLHLVIFNSCDGLGIGQQLASWCIPQVIVMREIVSDDVAQKFLQYFLESYAHQEEKPFYLAVREAREKLSFLERQCPGATWLPVIFQNPSEVPLSWQQLCNVRANSRKQETSGLANNSDRISSTRQVPEKLPINIKISNETIPSDNLPVSKLGIIVVKFYHIIKYQIKWSCQLMFSIFQEVKRLFAKLFQPNVEEFPQPELSQEQTIETPPLSKSKEHNAGGLPVVAPPIKRPLPTLQEQLDLQADNNSLTLRPPNCEYPGPIAIDRPIILDGQGATVWALKGPVVSINSDNVILRNLRIEVTGNENSIIPEENCAILVKSFHRVQFDNVEVRGTVMGIPEEEGDWKYPNPLNLGQLAYGREYNLLLRIVVPVACEVTSDISGLEFAPRHLTPGANEIQLHIEKLPQDTLINGSIFFLLSPSLKRRIALTAHIVPLPNEPVPVGQNHIVWEPEDWSAFVPGQQQQTQLSEPVSVISAPIGFSLTLPDVDTRVPPIYPEGQPISGFNSEPRKIRREVRPEIDIFQPDQPDVSIQKSSESISSSSRPVGSKMPSSIFVTPTSPSDSLNNPEDFGASSVSERSQSINSIFNPTSSLPLEKPEIIEKPDSAASASASAEGRSAAINPLFEQALIPNKPSDRSGEEIKQESLQTNDIFQPSKRKIVRSNGISPLFEDNQKKEQPNE